MTDVVHEHHTSDSSGGMGFLMGFIAIALFIYLLFAFGLPALRRGSASPQINVPEQVDVNVNQGQGGGQ